MGVFIISARQVPTELMNSPEFEAFVNICGGTFSKAILKISVLFRMCMI